MMAYSIRGLFGVSAIVAVFAAAVMSRNDLAILVASLLFVLLILLGSALAFVATESRNFWRGFAVVGLGTVLLSPQVELFEHLSRSINARLRPVSVFYSSSSQSPVSLSTIYPLPMLPASTGNPNSVASAPVYWVNAGNYSTGTSIDQQLQKLLVLGSAILFGACRRRDHCGSHAQRRAIVSGCCASAEFARPRQPLQLTMR